MYGHDSSWQTMIWFCFVAKSLIKHCCIVVSLENVHDAIFLRYYKEHKYGLHIKGELSFSFVLLSAALGQ